MKLNQIRSSPISTVRSVADTSTTEYFNGRTGLKVSMDTVDFANGSTSIKSSPQQIHLREPSLTKLDSIDVVDCKLWPINPSLHDTAPFRNSEQLMNLIFFSPFYLDKKLSRGISRATENENLVSRARTEIAMDLHSSGLNPMESVQPNIDTPDYTFTLPDLTIYSDDFRKFLEKDLIECSTLNSLESAQRLNWWAEAGFCRKLWPLATSGDGNCLLHAASLAMWGFHDRKLTLRTALYSVLSEGEYKDALWRRWRFQQTRLNKQAGFVYSEIEWTKEWQEIVNMASPEPRQAKGTSRRRSIAINESIDDNATYDSLEEIHIFALAHVLRRTIIVVADTVLRDMNGEAISPIPFGGVYIPFEIADKECYRAPLLLTYDMAHFSALVSMESSNEQPPALIPLIDYENVLLPIHFCIDPGADFDWKSYDGSEGNWALTDREHIALLKEYLDIVYASPLGSPDEEISADLVDEEYDKRILDGELGFAEENGGVNNKSKAAKQLQSVAKQFGSIGKSMSKKIKKNIGSITKIGSNANSNGGKSSKKGSLSSGTSTQSFTRQRILCAQLKAKRHDYQEEMIKNYLECAQDRFVDTEKAKELREIEQYQLDMLKKKAETPVIEPERETSCINAGCTNYGTSATSYMCTACFEKQKERELNNSNNGSVQDGARFGTGNSRFYTHADQSAHKSIKRLPSVRRLNDCDQTLYLSNSTFYNDKRPQTTISNGTNISHGYSPTELSPRHGKTVIIPIRMESDLGENIVDHHSSDYSAATAATNVARNGTTHSIFTTSPPPTSPVTQYQNHNQSPPHNILGISRDDNLPSLSSSSGSTGPYTSTITIGNSNENGHIARNSYADVLLQKGSGENNIILTSYTDRPDESSSNKSSRLSAIPTPFSQMQAQHCRTRDCKFFGSADTNYFCSKCGLHQPKTQSKILTDV